MYWLQLAFFFFIHVFVKMLTQFGLINLLPSCQTPLNTFQMYPNLLTVNNATNSDRLSLRPPMVKLLQRNVVVKQSERHEKFQSVKKFSNWGHTFVRLPCWFINCLSRQQHFNMSTLKHSQLQIYQNYQIRVTGKVSKIYDSCCLAVILGGLMQQTNL